MRNIENHIVLSTSTLTGIAVKNMAGEKLGEIKDMVVDTATGQIIYAVLSVDAGFMAIQDKYFAIPWKAFQIDTTSQYILLDMDLEKLKNAPGFDKNDWPEAPQKEFINEMYSHYGYDPYYFITE